LSFTERYPDVVGENTINTAYEFFIRDVLKADVYNGADRKKTNLLALAVRRLITKPPGEGFFFPHFQYDNADTKKKLMKACGDCLVFVQLVRNIMFVAPKGGRMNWCLYEFQTVFDLLKTKDEREQRMLFIVSENEHQLMDRLNVPPPYRAWHAYVAQRDPP